MKNFKFPLVLILVSVFAFALSCSPESAENETQTITEASLKKTVEEVENTSRIRYTNTILIEYLAGTSEATKQAVRAPYYASGYLVDHTLCVGKPNRETWYVNEACEECRPNDDSCKPTCSPGNNGDVGQTYYDEDCSL